MMNELFNLLLISLGINVIVFMVAYNRQSDKLTDIAYSISFVTLILVAFFMSEINYYKIFLVVFISIWAIRLGGFLLIRIQYFGRDKRFDERRGNFVRLLSFFLLQGVSVFIILIPSLIFIFSEETSVNLISLFGVLIWLIGLIIESISDNQKFRFIVKGKNISDYISNGLWEYSRHPNYFGEILVWIGIFMYCIPTLYSLGVVYLFLGLVSPVFIFVLLRYISGIPILEKRAEKKFAHNRSYHAYKRRTPILVVNFFKK